MHVFYYMCVSRLLIPIYFKDTYEIKVESTASREVGLRIQANDGQPIDMCNQFMHLWSLFRCRMHGCTNFVCNFNYLKHFFIETLNIDSHGFQNLDNAII